MPRSKKTGRLEIRTDIELETALEILQGIYANSTKTEIIREAIIEKAKRDARKPRKTDY